MNKRISSRMLYQGKIINLRLDVVELPGGEQAEREVVEHPGACAIVPLDRTGDVRFVGQYRDAVGERLLEIPAGKLKAGEDPRQCALRELEEELGVTSDKLTHMATFYSTPGFCDEVMHLFLAEELRPGDGGLEPEPYVFPETRPLEPLEDLVSELKDAKSLVGILMAHQVVANRR